MSGMWKGELRKAVSEIQAEYDRQLEVVRLELEQKMVLQIQKMQAGVNRDNKEIKQLKDENTLIRSRLEMTLSKTGDLESELAKQKVNAQIEMEMKNQTEEDYNNEIRKLRDLVNDYEKRIETFVDELKVIQNAKLSLESEILMYRKLLECEEKKFASPRNLDETALAEIREIKRDPVQQKTEYDEIVGNVKMSKACRSTISISNASIDGAYVTIENTGAEKRNLKGWKIERENDRGRITSKYVFGDVTLEAGKDLTIFAAGDESEQYSDKDLAASFYTWGAGSGEYKLYGTESQEENDHDVMASLSMEFSLQKEQTASSRNINFERNLGIICT
ncbi:hypothetical protein KUTeg_022410 [Tegillarca granosa]|uniref:LTD domain-containing protein n=1 Tax=Tegillarca granosa TaxID=220873 RepID=A0ABQ9E652_TEGGR|nr:hypothetical protein KUTeg_022410 [Tegillarca granosa]